MAWNHRWASACLLLGVISVASEADAYCLTRTCEFGAVDCEWDPISGCATVGDPVFWSESCVPYAIQADGSPQLDITAQQFAPFVADGFRVWSEAPCAAGGTPPVASASQGFIACDAVEYNCGAGDANSNLFVFRDDFDEATSGLGRFVIALTTLTVNVRTGELFDADVEINSRDQTFALLAPDDPSDPRQARDMRAVVNHELGHVLGLSHSAERAALMAELYLSREPNADDVAGICAAIAPAETDATCRVAALPAGAACLGDDQTCPVATTGEAGCGCRLAGARYPSPGRYGSLLLALAAAFAARRSGRRWTDWRARALRGTWGALLLVGLLPRTALAYCRTDTCEFDARVPCRLDPDTGCAVGGVPTRWSTGCVSFAVESTGSRSRGITAQQLSEVVQDGFRLWTELPCAGSSSPSLAAGNRGTTRCDHVEFHCTAGDDNVNVITFRDEESDLDPATIALTTVIANLNTGEVLDVDVELNSARFDFHVDAEDSTPTSRDLRLVLNHEIGHFLGLAHSPEPDALMWAAYFGIDANPSEDDADGMCEIFDGSSSDPTCSVVQAPPICVGASTRCAAVQHLTDGSGACGVARSGGRATGSFVLLGVLGAWALRRRGGDRFEALRRGGAS